MDIDDDDYRDADESYTDTLIDYQVDESIINLEEDPEIRRALIESLNEFKYQKSHLNKINKLKRQEELRLYKIEKELREYNELKKKERENKVKPLIKWVMTQMRFDNNEFLIKFY